MPDSEMTSTSELRVLGESRVLQLHEREIVCTLKEADLVNLAERLCRHTLICRDVKDNFSTLDHENLDSELKVRYLLQSIYDIELYENDRFNSLMNVFRDLGSHMENVCKRVEEDLDVSFNADLSSGLEGSPDYSKGLLSEKNVPVLTELLAEGSNKWEEISIILGLLEHERKECQNGSSNMIRLNNVLTIWVRRRNVHVKCPTLYNLKQALCSGMVGLPRVADNLEKKFSKKTEEHCEISSTPTIQSLKLALSSETVGLQDIAYALEKKFGEKMQDQYKISSKKEAFDDRIRITYLSNDTIVANGKSALIGVKAISSKPIQYQWSKNRIMLSNSQTYCGISRAVLFIDAVRQKQEGSYCCHISTTEYDMYVEIVVQVLYLPITRFLSKIYSRFDEVPKETWPPVLTTFYIDMDLVVRKGSGNVKPNHDSKEKIKFEEAFCKYESGALVLVEGRPGSGKTTLLHKVSKDWACKKNVLVDAELVILVHLEHFRAVNGDLTLSDILKEYFTKEDDRIKVLSDIEKSHGERVCIIIDGLDEYENRYNRHSVIYKLIHKKVLPMAMVIVASRPGSTALIKLTAPVTKRLEILGFTEELVFRYINTYYKENKDLAFKLWNHLKKHGNVLRLCCIPVHAAIICFLYCTEGEGIPPIETKIYEKLIFETISRNADIKNIKRDGLSLLNCLPEDIKRNLNKLCKLAFDMLTNSKQVVLQRETEVHLSDSTTDSAVPSLGLVTIDRTNKLEAKYTFLHLTLQEYLAALYLAMFAGSTQLNEIKNLVKRRDFHNVLKFFCGMTIFDDDKLFLLKDMMATSDIDTLNKIHFALESQQAVVCDSIVKYSETNTLSFTDYNLTSTDFSAIVYVISNSSFDISKLVFEECDLSIDGVVILVKTLNTACMKVITHLVYKKRSFSVSDLETLNILLNQLTSLEILDLQSSVLSVMEITVLTNDVQLPHLRILKVNINPKEFVGEERLLKFGSNKLEQLWWQYSNSNNYIRQCEDSANFITAMGCIGVIGMSDPGASLVDLVFCCNTPFSHTSLKDLSSCSHLVLINCNINDDDVKWLIQSTNSWTELRTLRLDFNKITKWGAFLLCLLINKCTRLNVFSAHCNKIDYFGARELAIALAYLSNPPKFGLQYNAVSVSEITKIEMATKCRNKKLQHCLQKSTRMYRKSLKQTLVIVQKGDIDACANAIKCCKFVRRLSICSFDPSTLLTFEWIFNSPKGSAVLGEALQYCENVEHLNISKNNIGSRCAVSVISGIKCYSSLSTLDISSNSIGLDGVKALAEVLKHCSNLCLLSLGSNKIGSKGAKFLADGLKCCKELQRLDLRKNGIGSDGAIALAEGLTFLNLISLDLSYNNIGSHAAKSLSDAIKHNNSIGNLQLGNNHIGSLGVVHLGEGLKVCTELQLLSLRSNDISSEGSLALSRALASCENLQILSLDSNNIDSDGASDIADALKQCKNLKMLYLGSNTISGESENYLRSTLS